MNNDRLKHSYAVANKMVELGKERKLSNEQLKELFVLGYLHDIGYQYGTNENHNEIGGNLLKENNYNVICAHVNHNLREESKEEAKMVERYCKNRNISSLLARKCWNRKSSSITTRDN